MTTTPRCRPSPSCLLALGAMLSVVAGCGSDGAAEAEGTGGVPAPVELTGGSSPGAGQVPGAGGGVATGGAAQAGGSGNASGGAAGTTTGGAGSGGQGPNASGGVAGGSAGTGASPGAGGIAGGSGGSPEIGGSPGTGAAPSAGASGTGASPSTGGSPSVGGSPGTGGSAAGGTAGTGGTNPGTGGSAATGGSPGTGGAPETGGAGSGGTGGSGEGGCAGVTSGVSASVIHYVSPDGTPSGDGTSFETAIDYATALANVGAGEMVLLEPGTYSVPYAEGAKNTIVLDQSGQSGALISVVAANCGRAVLDFSFPEQAWVQDSYGLSLTGSYWYFKGIDITRSGYQGVYVTGQHNTFENCSFHDNRNTGLEINKGGAYTTVINCDAYRNYDPKNAGGMADGFGPKQTQGPGNRLIGCRAWENSDDGFDTFDSPEVVTFEGCWAFRNGVDVWNYGGFSGNGNGFKIGGNSQQQNNQLRNCVAFGNLVKGFDQNNNTGGLLLYNCTGYDNATNFALGGVLNSGQQHELRNNVSLGSTDTIANADAQYNSWNLGVSVSAADFVSVDSSLATVARNADGTLPETGLFRLAPSSDLIDAGVDVGLPYSGSAPDLGAFETTP